MNFFGCIPRFIKNHAGWILTGLGSAGFIGTTVLAAKEAPRASSALWQASLYKTANEFPEKDVCEIYCMVEDGKLDPVDLTLWEKIKVAAPHYIPAILAGTGTLACFWGAQIFNMKTQGALIAAYGALGMEFSKYREAITDEYGEEADRNALIYAQSELKRLRKENAELMSETHQLYGFAWLPGVVMDANPRDIIDVLGQWNRNLVIRGWNDLCELNQFLDIPEMCYDKEQMQQFGWNEYEDEVTWGQLYIDFEFEKVETPYGTIKVIHTPMSPPYRLDANYGEVSSTDPENECFFYNTPLAIELARKIGANDIIQTAHPAAHYPVYCIG